MDKVLFNLRPSANQGSRGAWVAAQSDTQHPGSLAEKRPSRFSAIYSRAKTARPPSYWPSYLPLSGREERTSSSLRSVIKFLMIRGIRCRWVSSAHPMSLSRRWCFLGVPPSLCETLAFDPTVSIMRVGCHRALAWRPVAFSMSVWSSPSRSRGVSRSVSHRPAQMATANHRPGKTKLANEVPNHDHSTTQPRYSSRPIKRGSRWNFGSTLSSVGETKRNDVPVTP